MTNFTDKAQARAYDSIGKNQAAISRTGKDAMGLTLPNKDRLALARAAAQNRMKAAMMRTAQSSDSNNPPLVEKLKER